MANDSFSIKQLAEKWCRLGDHAPSNECECAVITAAVCEALKEAEGRIEALYQPQRGLVPVDAAITALWEG